MGKLLVRHFINLVFLCKRGKKKVIIEIKTQEVPFAVWQKQCGNSNHKSSGHIRAKPNFLAKASKYQCTWASTSRLNGKTLWSKHCAIELLFFSRTTEEVGQSQWENGWSETQVSPGRKPVGRQKTKSSPIAIARNHTSKFVAKCENHSMSMKNYVMHYIYCMCSLEYMQLRVEIFTSPQNHPKSMVYFLS